MSRIVITCPPRTRDQFRDTLRERGEAADEVLVRAIEAYLAEPVEIPKPSKSPKAKTTDE